MKAERLVDNLDDRIFDLLLRPWMHFQGPEAMVSTVLELVAIRRWATSAGDFDHIEVLRRMGFVDRSLIQFPDRLTDDIVELLRVIAIELGHQPGDRPARAAAWKKHWSECAACQIGREDERCATGRVLWNGMPWA